MTQIQKLYTSRLRHPEFAQLVVRFLDDLDKKGLSVAKEDIVEKLLTDLRTNLPHFQQSLEQVRASEKSVSISEADEQRDADFKHFVIVSSLTVFQNVKQKSLPMQVSSSSSTSTKTLQRPTTSRRPPS